MPKCIDATIKLGRLGRRVIETNFGGGEISTDGGVLLLRRVDERIGLSRAAAAAFSDPRDPARIEHSLRDLLAQRIYGPCWGYEDLNDHDTSRGDRWLVDPDAPNLSELGYWLVRRAACCDSHQACSFAKSPPKARNLNSS